VEDEFNRERSALTDANFKEVESEFNRHRDTERKFSLDKTTKMQKNASDLEELRSKDAND